MLTQCRADIRAKQTARLLVFHRFPIGSGRGTAHTANEANPFVPPIQVSGVFGQIWKSQFFTNPNPSILFRKSVSTQFLHTGLTFFLWLLSLPPKDDYGSQAETLMCSQKILQLLIFYFILLRTDIFHHFILHSFLSPPLNYSWFSRSHSLQVETYIFASSLKKKHLVTKNL